MRNVRGQFFVEVSVAFGAGLACALGADFSGRLLV